MVAGSGIARESLQLCWKRLERGQLSDIDGPQACSPRRLDIDLRIVADVDRFARGDAETAQRSLEDPPVGLPGPTRRGNRNRVNFVQYFKRFEDLWKTLVEV